MLGENQILVDANQKRGKHIWHPHIQNSFLDLSDMFRPEENERN